MAVEDEGVLRRALEELGLSPEAIEEDLELYRLEVEPAFLVGDRQKAFSRLRALLKRRKVTVGRHKDTTIKVPLFKLSSPRVPHARVTCEEMRAASRRGGWSLKLLGTGMGATQTVGIEYMNAYSCEEGNYELIYAPIPVRVSEIRYVEKGRERRGVRVEVSAHIREHGVHKGIDRLDAKELRRDLRRADEIDRFLAAGTGSSTKVKRSRKWHVEGEFEGQIGVPAFNLMGMIRTSVRQRREVKLISELPGGHDYTLLQLREGRGVVWKVD